MEERNPFVDLVNQNHERVVSQMALSSYQTPIEVVKVEKASDKEIRQAETGLLQYFKENAKQILAGTVAVVTIATAATALLHSANERTDRLMETYDSARESISATYNAQVGDGAFDNLPFERQQELIARQIEENNQTEKTNGVK